MPIVPRVARRSRTERRVAILLASVLVLGSMLLGGSFATGAVPGTSIAGAPGANPPVVAGNWTKLRTSPTPTPRGDAAMAYDLAAGYLLLFGGLGKTSYLGDSWAFSGGNWTKLAPANSPPARYGASMAYDAADGYMVLFGGMGYISGTYTALGDTWIFANGTWTLDNSTYSPSARFGATMAYDAKDHYLVLFGGAGPSGPLNDTWEFVAGQWSRLAPTLSPPSMVWPSMTYDASDGYLLLFGSGGRSAENWTFEGGNWTRIKITGDGGFLRDHFLYSSVAYDSSRGYVVLFGGTCFTPGPRACKGDTWVYRNGAWTTLHLHPVPAFRDDASLSYDPAGKYLVLFGGIDASLRLSTTWTYT